MQMKKMKKTGARTAPVSFFVTDGDSQHSKLHHP
jgi:hypothetical protein